MLYFIVILVFLVTTMLVANYLYKNAAMNNKSAFSWHRLIANTVYVIQLKTYDGVWEIEFDLDSDKSFITSGIDKTKKLVSIDVPRKGSLLDVRKHMLMSTLPNHELQLFFDGFEKPELMKTILVNSSDYNSFCEVVFFMKNTLAES